MNSYQSIFSRVLLTAAFSTIVTSSAFALSCRDTREGIFGVKLGAGQRVELCIWADCYRGQYRGNPDRQINFRMGGVVGEMVKRSANRYRLKFTLDKNTKSLGLKYETFPMRCS